MSSSFGFRSFFRNKAAVCKVGDQSLENNQPSGEPIVELLRNKMNVIGTAQEYKSPAVCLLHMEKSTVDIFTMLSNENITMNVKYVRYLIMMV